MVKKIGLSILLLFSGVQLSGEVNSDTLAVNVTAPMFILRDMENNYIYLNDFSGDTLRKPYLNNRKHVVIISFFTSYCIPCKKEIPILEKIARLYDGYDIKIYLVNLREKQDQIRKYLDKNPHITLPVLTDPYGYWAEKYGVYTVPALFVIDRNGIVRFINRGFSSEEEFSERIIPLLDELLEVSTTPEDSDSEDEL